MKLTNSLIQNVYATARRLSRDIRDGCGQTHEDIAQNALVILLKMATPESGVRSENGLAYRAIKYAMLQSGRSKSHILDDADPDFFPAVYDHRDLGQLATDLRLDGDGRTLQQLKEVYCG